MCLMTEGTDTRFQFFYSGLESLGPRGANQVFVGALAANTNAASTGVTAIASLWVISDVESSDTTACLYRSQTRFFALCIARGSEWDLLST